MFMAGLQLIYVVTRNIYSLRLLVDWASSFLIDKLASFSKDARWTFFKITKEPILNNLKHEKCSQSSAAVFIY